MKLTPLATEVLEYLQGRDWTSPAHAFMDLGISGGSFTKRLSELRNAGFGIERENRHHPNTGRLYRVFRLNLDVKAMPAGTQQPLPLFA